MLKSQKSLKKQALLALLEIINDRNGSLAARASAARTLLEAVGAIGRLQENALESTVQAHNMTENQLDSEIQRLRKLVAMDETAPSPFGSDDQPQNQGSVIGSRKKRSKINGLAEKDAP